MEETLSAKLVNVQSKLQQFQTPACDHSLDISSIFGTLHILEENVEAFGSALDPSKEDLCLDLGIVEIPSTFKSLETQISKNWDFLDSCHCGLEHLVHNIDWEGHVSETLQQISSCKFNLFDAVENSVNQIASVK